ncbi:MAG: VCBS repeat-containing protein [Bacteroidota bacterium]
MINQTFRYNLFLLSSLLLALSACSGETSDLPANSNAGTESVDTADPNEGLAMDQWEYVMIDDQKARWGDYAEPEWLNYFGLALGDLNNDGKPDIVSGRSLYLQPADPSDSWKKIDLGLNVDANIIVYLGEERGMAILGQSLPQVYQFLPSDDSYENWVATDVARVRATGHHNGQGYRTGQIVKGGAEEILYASQGGIYLLEADGLDDWPVSLIGPDASDEGFDLADIDGDGDLDLAAGYRAPGVDAEVPTSVVWFENPGDGSEYWNRHPLGQTKFAVDRVEMADLNGDERVDVIVAEERYPGEEPDASLYVFLQQDTGWQRQTVVTQFSMNNLDAADFDQDGDQDLVTAEHKGERLSLQIWENDGAANFSKLEIDHGKESHLGTQAHDVDGDGDLDLVSIGWDEPNYIHLWLNRAIE